jgi:hypothetical protein
MQWFLFRHEKPGERRIGVYVDASDMTWMGGEVRKQDETIRFKSERTTIKVTQHLFLYLSCVTHWHADMETQQTDGRRRANTQCRGDRDIVLALIVAKRPFVATKHKEAASGQTQS